MGGVLGALSWVLGHLKHFSDEKHSIRIYIIKHHFKQQYSA